MEEIERLAEEFLAGVPSYVWDGETLPVPIEDIADTHVGLLVRDVEDLGTAPGRPELGHGQALSGLLLPALGEIWVNAEEARQWPPRRRFTIAHELGHWRLHRDAAEHAVFCRSGSIASDDAERARAAPTRRGRGQRLRGRRSDAGAAGPGAVRQLRPRLLPLVRDLRGVRRGDGAAPARGGQAVK